MRKILSFLALLVVGFAIPWHAGAWDFNGGSSPSGITINFTQGHSGNLVLDFNKDKSDYKWEKEFTATADYFNFNITFTEGSWTGTYGHNQGNGNPFDDKTCDASSNSSTYYQSGLTNGHKYRFELKGISANQFNFRVVPIPSTLYLYECNSSPTKVGTATYSNGKVLFEDITLDPSKKYIFSEEDSDNWDTVNSKRYNPSSDATLSTSESSFKYGNTEKTWVVSSNNNYDITLDWANFNIKIAEHQSTPVVETPWNFSSSKKPKALSVGFNSGASGSVTFNFSDGLWTSNEFTATGTEVKFYFTATDDNGKTQNICHNLGSSTIENWVSDSQIADGNVAYYQQGLTSGNNYKIEVKGDGDNKLQWRVVDVTPVPTYPATLYIWAKNSNAWDQNKGNSTGNNGEYNFTNIVLDSADEVTFTTSTTSGWGNFNSNGSKQYGNSLYPDVTSGTSYSIAQGAGGYKLAEGTYDIVLNLTDNTVIFTKQTEPVTYPTLYLYQDTSGWAAAALASAESTDGKYTFTVKLTKDKAFTFTTKSDGINNYNFGGETRYYQNTNSSSDYTVSNGSETNFKPTTDATTGKSWKPSAAGEYTIEVNTVNETFKVTNFVAETPVVTTTDVYIYHKTGNGDSWNKGDKGTYADGMYSYTITLAEGEYFVFSTKTPSSGSTLSWSGMGTTRYCANGSNFTVSATGETTAKADGDAAYVAGKEGQYKFRLDTTNGKLYIDEVPTTIVTYDPIYLYINNGGDSWTNKGAGSYTGGKFIYTVTLTQGQAFVFSTKSTGSSWSTMGDDRYCVNGSDKTMGKDNDTSATLEKGGEKAMKASEAGDYTISYDPSNNSIELLSYPGMITDTTKYLYAYIQTGVNQNKWKRGISAKPDADDNYKFTLRLKENDVFVFSTHNDNELSWEGMANKRYANTGLNGNDYNISNGTSTNFNTSDDKAWKASAAGTYSITVNPTNNTFVVTGFVAVTALQRNMPLTSKDFEGNKKHYFIVGERHGEWHLQPEWEFKQVDGEFVLTNKFVYNGKLAVAMVNNYADYLDHKYNYYSWNGGTQYDLKSDANEVDINFKSNVSPVKGDNNNNENNNVVPNNSCLYASYDTGFTGSDSDPAKNNYYQGDGQYMTKITISLDSNGAPNHVKFVPGTDAQAKANRVFTLVGSDIYNYDYCNSAYTTKSPTFNEGGTTDDGWQEGWIQYNPNTLRPYVDGRNEYLYHTSFDPYYLTENPVLFKQPLSDGSMFSYTSDAVTFVESSLLPKIDEDPYKDFYSAFSGRDAIQTTETKKQGNGYDFSVQVVTGKNQYGDHTPTNGEWKCYVVRDMWIAGEIKFWTGWGGNQDYTNGGSAGMVVFHGPNGGPRTGAEHSDQEVKGFDINAGKQVEIYRNVKNLNDANYKISDGQPVYFDRVILWYNESEGVDNSFIQFLQASAGPAIFARISDEKDNYIRYNWYLNKAQNEQDKSRLVFGYTINRYQWVDGQSEFLGYPESEYVALDTPVTVEQLYEENAGNLSFTSFLDKGPGGNGFDPGLYFYTVTVRYDSAGEDAPTKNATSNRVPVYGSDYVTPEALAYQIVKLDNKEDAGTKIGLNKNQEYITYNPASGSTLYAFNITTSEGVEIPTDVERVANRTTAINYLRDNQNKTTWTSDYYVRCLDYDEYEDRLTSLVDAELYNSFSEPQVKVYQVAETGQDILLGNAAEFDYNGHRYYSLIARRQGVISKSAFLVHLQYSAENKTTSTSESFEADRIVDIAPVMPRPYGAVLTYAYSHEKETAHGLSGKYAKINVPVNNVENSQNVTETQDVYLELDGFHPRNLALQVTFQRPNVAQNIFEKYDIDYNVALTNNLSSDVVLNATAELKDAEYVSDKYGKGYRFNFSGVHPGNGITPNVRFANTVYTSRTDATRKDATGTFGNGINQSAEHIYSTERGAGFENGKIYLGKIKRDNGTWDWAYKGHTTFDDKSDKIAEAEMEPNYYLFEISNDNGDSNVYEYLVPHHSECIGNDAHLNTDAWYVDNDDDPLTLTYIAKGFSTDAYPTVKVTAIYVFERPVLPQGVEHDDFNTVQVNGMVFANNGNAAYDFAAIAAAKAEAQATAANGRHKVSASQGLIDGNAGSMPDTGTHRDASGNLVYESPSDNITFDMNANHAVTGYSSYVAVKGETYTYTTDDLVVTGVEDILAGYENEGEAVFYNLQGIQIDTPTTPGVYIRVQGKNATKVVIK